MAQLYHWHEFWYGSSANHPAPPLFGLFDKPLPTVLDPAYHVHVIRLVGL